MKKSAFFTLILLLLIVVPGAVAQASFDECNGIYQRFLDNRKGPELEKLQTAIAAGREHLSKCSELAESEKVKEYLNKNLPLLEKIAAELLEERQYVAAYKAKDYAKAFALGQRILERQPENGDLLLTLMSIGYETTRGKPRSTATDETIRLARTSLEKLNSDTLKSTKDFATFGAGGCDGKSNARGWAEYIIGNLTWSALDDKKGALVYLYRAAQLGCETKKQPDVYLKFAARYNDEYTRLSDDYDAKLKANKGETNAEADKVYELLRGYADRSLDAMGRAYVAMSVEAANAAKRDELMKNIRSVYVFRFSKEDGLDAYLKGLSSTPLPDPTIAVQPIPLVAAK